MNSEDKAGAREKARHILAKVLGLEATSSNIDDHRPRDNEDFYLLGGTSLMVAIAIDDLRECGFKTNLEAFTITGNIGRILDSLLSSEEAKPVGLAPNRVSLNQNEFIQMEEILIERWMRHSTANGEATFNEALQLLINEFYRSDLLGRSFGFSRSDFEVFTYFVAQPKTQSFMLTAKFQPVYSMPLYGTKPNQILGAALCTPTKNVLPLTESQKFVNFQKYFDYAMRVVHPADLDFDRSLTATMIAVQTPDIDTQSYNYDAIVSRWNRVKVAILLQLEREILLTAKKQNFSIVEAINASQATKEACLELGYEILNVVRLRDFAEEMHVEVDPTYYDHRSYYMIKRLTD